MKSCGPKLQTFNFLHASSSAVVAGPRLPQSQWEAQALASLPSKLPSPPTITAGGSDFVVLLVETALAFHALTLSIVVETASHYQWQAAQCTEISPVGLPHGSFSGIRFPELTFPPGANNKHETKSCKQPQGPEKKNLDEELMKRKLEA